ncbi:hypothetical protein AAV98_05490 [Bacillus sp. CHD6a]|nr:hypothetical protein AAV98_05490 [Bacillus sp. CHD6a]
MEERGSIFLKNIFYAFLAQGISLCLSVLMSLIVPKLLGVEEYSYWQLFLFYSSYVGFFYFGLNDGIYLRIGGSNYKNLDFSLLGTQFKVATVINAFISILIIIFSLIFIEDSKRLFVLIMSALYLIVYNAVGFLGFIFQAVNKTKNYSISVIIDRIIFIIFVLVLLLFNSADFRIYVILFFLSKVVSLFYLTIVGKEIIYSSFRNITGALKEMWKNIAVGINLMFSNIASMLVLGNVRFIIDRKWGITEFGMFSFALSLTTFFLLFINQISIVLFPTLRQIKEDSLNYVYNVSRIGLSLFFPVVFLLYYPMIYLLNFWLPQYKDSFIYWALLLPICTFDGKMQMLCSTFFKVLRKERLLLLINIFTMIISIILSVVGAYVIGNLYSIIIFLVLSIAIRSIIAELYLSKLMGISVIKDLILEIGVASSFIISFWYLNVQESFLVFSLVYFIFLLINWNKLKYLIRTLFHLKFKN